MSCGRGLRRAVHSLPRPGRRSPCYESTWAACTSSPCSPSSCGGTTRTCCCFDPRSTSRAATFLSSSSAPRTRCSCRSKERQCAWERTASVSICAATPSCRPTRSEEHTSELQSHSDLVCRLLLEKKKKKRRSTQLEHEIHTTSSTSSLQR